MILNGASLCSVNEFHLTEYHRLLLSGWFVRLNRFFCLFIVLVSVASAATDDPVVLHRGTAAAPWSLDPTLAAGTMASPIVTDMYVGLMARNEKSVPELAGATEWTVSEDGTVYTFKLRTDLRWSDGKLIDADDFVYSYRRLIDPKTGSFMGAPFFVFENARKIIRGEAEVESLGVTALDKFTVEFRLTQPVPYFLELIGNMQLGLVPRHVIEKYGKAWTRPGRMVSSGPFVLAERVPQSYVKLVKNPYFYDADSVQIDEVYYHPTQDLATSLRRFRVGELDIVLNYPSDKLAWIRENIPETLHRVPSPGTYFLVINMAKPPFDDLRVRRALNIALDREAITDKLLRTGVTPAYAWTPTVFDNYDGITIPDQLVPLNERQELARKLLREAGFGEDNPLRFTLQYDTKQENRKIMVALAAMWQAVGVQAEIINMEFRMLNRKINTGDFEVIRWFYMASYNDPYAFLQNMDGDSPNNWPRFSSTEYDELLYQSNLAKDPDERQRLLQRAETVFMSEYPMIPLFYYIGKRLISTDVKGWIDSSRGTPPSRYLRLERE